MTLEGYFKKLAPYCVGWYGIASVLDAMFASMTGLSFFVGSVEVRVALTLADIALAVFVWHLMAKSEKRAAAQRWSLHSEAAEAVKRYIDFTCAPTPAHQPNTMRFNPAHHTDYMQLISTASGILHVDMFTKQLKASMEQRALAAQYNSTVHSEAYPQKGPSL
jgi:hypothetical protein